MTSEELEWLQFKYAINAALPHTPPKDAQWQNVWWMFDGMKKAEPTEEEKAVHRAMSFNNGDGKRFGHGQFIGDDE